MNISDDKEIEENKNKQRNEFFTAFYLNNLLDTHTLPFYIAIMFCQWIYKEINIYIPIYRYIYIL